jgi:hypothetical protein
MSTLANSLWSVSCNGTEAGTDTVKFFEGGKAVIAFPNGSTAKGLWAEAADGHFIFHPYSLSNAEAQQVYFGVYEKEEGQGQLCEINSLFCQFTMRRES